VFIYLNFLFFFFKNKYVNITNYLTIEKDFIWLWGSFLNNFIFNIFIIILLIVIKQLVNKNYNFFFKTNLFYYIIYFEINKNYNFYENTFWDNNNINLTNGLVNIHPNFILICYSYIFILLLINIIRKNKFNLFFFFYSIKIQSIFFFKIIFIGLFLGAWWSSQELNWGGWWNWDPVEFSGFILMLVFIINLHYIITYFKVKNIKYLLFLIIILNFLTTRLDLLNSIHNFIVSDLTNININYIILIIILLILFKTNNNKKLNFNFNKLIFSKIFNITILCLLLLILLNFLNQFNNEQLLQFFKKILLFISLLYFYTLIKINNYIKVLLIINLSTYFNLYLIFFYILSYIFKKNNLLKYHKTLPIIIMLMFINFDYNYYYFYENNNNNLNYYFNNIINYYKVSENYIYSNLNINFFNFLSKSNFNDMFTYLKHITKYEFFNFKLNYSLYFENLENNNLFKYVYNNHTLIILYIIFKVIFLKNINLKFF